MAYGKRRSSEDSKFLRLTGLWIPRNQNSKAIGQGNFTRKILEEALERMEDVGADKFYVSLFKNDYAENRNDPRYVLTGAPAENRDDEGRSRPKSKYKSRDEEEEEDGDEETEEDGEDEESYKEEPRKGKASSNGKRKTSSRGRKSFVDDGEESPF